MFIAAGRVDVLATDVEFVIEPDSGVSGIERLSAPP
jgi:hypothetical protein